MSTLKVDTLQDSSGNNASTTEQIAEQSGSDPTIFNCIVFGDN